MNREAWHAAVHGVTKSRPELSNWTELNWTEGIKLCILWGPFTIRFKFWDKILLVALVTNADKHFSHKAIWKSYSRKSYSQKGSNRSLSDLHYIQKIRKDKIFLPLLPPWWKTKQNKTANRILLNLRKNVDWKRFLSACLVIICSLSPPFP